MPETPDQKKARVAAYNATPQARAARAAYEKTPAGMVSRRKANARSKGHNVLPEGRAWMLEQQGGACAFLDCDEDATHVDHDHETGHIRGLLCLQHNAALGKLGDNVVGLTRALHYVSH